MHGNLPVALEIASGAVVGSGTELVSDATAKDEDDWFGQIGRQILGKDAGLHLHHLTGLPEGSCYKYVTRQPHNRRQPPGFLLRQILRSTMGRQFLAGLMDGADCGWWNDLQRAERIASALDS